MGFSLATNIDINMSWICEKLRFKIKSNRIVYANWKNIND